MSNKPDWHYDTCAREGDSRDATTVSTAPIKRGLLETWWDFDDKGERIDGNQTWSSPEQFAAHCELNEFAVSEATLDRMIGLQFAFDHVERSAEFAVMAVVGNMHKYWSQLAGTWVGWESVPIEWAQAALEQIIVRSIEKLPSGDYQITADLYGSNPATHTSIVRGVQITVPSTIVRTAHGYAHISHEINQLMEELFQHRAVANDLGLPIAVVKKDLAELKRLQGLYQEYV